MYCGKCGKKIESTAGACYSCTSDPVFYGPVFPCPQCARFREKINREKMAQVLFGNDMLYSDYNAESRTGPVPKIWEDVSEGDKGYFREIADTILKHLTE